MRENDAKAATIRDYLVTALATLWSEGENFSGKRPFGNSGWEWDLLVPLITAGAITGTLDEDGYIDDVDEGAGNALIASAIEAMRSVA
jgi:hypothetical protein